MQGVGWNLEPRSNQRVVSGHSGYSLLSFSQRDPEISTRKAMENGGAVNHEAETVSTITIKGILSLIMQNIDEENGKRVITLGMGDPTAYSCFLTPSVLSEAVVDALQSNKFNGYAPTVGLLQTRK